jgi:hypothetical protein
MPQMTNARRVMIGLTLVATVTAAAGETNTQLETMINKAIEDFEPSQLPPPGELRGLVIVVQPTGGGAMDAAQRRRDDLSLLTAGHLFHHIQAGGGVPRLTRADDRPPPGSDAGTAGALARLCDEAKCHFIVSIESAPTSSPGASGLAATWLDDLEGTGIPGGRMVLSGPAPSWTEAKRMAYPRDCAVEIYRALVGYVGRERKKLEQRRLARWPDLAAAADTDPIPRYPDREPKDRLVRAAREIWPDGDLPIEKAAWFCRVFCRTSLSDRTVVYFEPHVTLDGDTVVLGGATNVPHLRELLVTALQAVGVQKIRNEMRVLPEEGRLDGARVGACVAPMALTFNRPSEAAGVQTQLLYGEPLLLLDRDAGYYLMHGGDGYWGWVRESCVRVMAADEFTRYTAADPAVLLRDLELGDRRVVQGSTLPVASRSGDRVTLMHPDGTTSDVAARDVRLTDNSQAIETRLDRALSLLHRPYVFGGVSPIGMDCSGLVRNVYGQTGLTMARDAAQQFLQGRLVATRWYRDNIQPGDLLFFVDVTGKIFHVGIAITPTHFVHCSPPEVQISSLQEGDRLYLEPYAHRFLAAKRP